MKKLLLILLVIGAAGCEISESNAQSPHHSVDTYTARINNLDAVVDGCEYFFNNQSGELTHKGNCKNCRKFYKELLKEK